MYYCCCQELLKNIYSQFFDVECIKNVKKKGKARNVDYALFLVVISIKI